MTPVNRGAEKVTVIHIGKVSARRDAGNSTRRRGNLPSTASRSRIGNVRKEFDRTVTALLRPQAHRQAPDQHQIEPRVKREKTAAGRPVPARINRRRKRSNTPASHEKDHDEHIGSGSRNRRPARGEDRDDVAHEAMRRPVPLGCGGRCGTHRRDGRARPAASSAASCRCAPARRSPERASD